MISPDSTFCKLHSEIYFTKVLSLAMRVRTIFWKTLLKIYSNLIYDISSAPCENVLAEIYRNKLAYITPNTVKLLVYFCCGFLFIKIDVFL